jgi:glycosyltransferase involved in cell wall biosynthesis
MNDDFKIHCIVLCKNEADVIHVCLSEAIKWADYIYVYDGGSTDGTWESVKKLNHPGIIPWKQDAKVFSEGLRAEVFNAFRYQSSKGDWWLQLNADEFYVGNPKAFFSRVPSGEDLVWGIMAEYVLTDEDITTIDFSLPFEEVMPLLQHYYVAWSEPRAFRYRDGLIWNENWAWPRHAGLVAGERLIYKHYPCRSPKQSQTRWKARRENCERGFEGWPEETERWRRITKNSKDFLFDDGISPLKIDESVLPRHLEAPYVRLARQILHRCRIWP